LQRRASHVESCRCGEIPREMTRCASLHRRSRPLHRFAAWARHHHPRVSQQQARRREKQRTAGRATCVSARCRRATSETVVRGPGVDSRQQDRSLVVSMPRCAGVVAVESRSAKVAVSEKRTGRRQCEELYQQCASSWLRSS
jgi:hypothetical protein